jgi:mRNA interferase MazF
MTIPPERMLMPGDIVLINFAPVRGSQQAGTRPGLVVSEPGMHDITRRANVCPITRNTQPWPTKVFLPQGLAAEGAVLTDQVRSIDRQERILRRLGRVPEEVLNEVRRKLAALLGIEVST